MITYSRLHDRSSDDINDVRSLFVVSFSNSVGKSEGLLVGNLAHELLTTTGDGSLLCFVANTGETIVGSIIFTRLNFDDGTEAFLLSPLAVRPDCQKQGVGQRLIRLGLATLKEKGIGVVFTYGDPSYYDRTGFHAVPQQVAKPPLKLTQPEGWLAQSLTSSELEPIGGNSHCVAALNKQEYW